MALVKKGGDSGLPLNALDVWGPIIKLATFVSSTHTLGRKIVLTRKNNAHTLMKLFLNNLFIFK